MKEWSHCCKSHSEGFDVLSPMLEENEEEDENISPEDSQKKNNQILQDDKSIDDSSKVEDDLVMNYIPLELNCGRSDPKISDDSVKVANRIGGNIASNLKPSVFLNEHQRTFANPISYLGGPHLKARNRWSAESVVSLD